MMELGRGQATSTATPAAFFARWIDHDTWPEWSPDTFRVRAEDGTVYGMNELTHDHASEQPFTRSLSGVQIPAGVTNVVVEGRDQANGWGGGTQSVELPA